MYIDIGLQIDNYVFFIHMTTRKNGYLYFAWPKMQAIWWMESWVMKLKKNNVSWTR